MKGGKAGRKRKSAGGGGAARQGSGPRARPAKGGARNPSTTAPKKGSRKNQRFGGTSSSGEE